MIQNACLRNILIKLKCLKGKQSTNFFKYTNKFSFTGKNINFTGYFLRTVHKTDQLRISVSERFSDAKINQSFYSHGSIFKSYTLQ